MISKLKEFGIDLRIYKHWLDLLNICLKARTEAGYMHSGSILARAGSVPAVVVQASSLGQ